MKILLSISRNTHTLSASLEAVAGSNLKDASNVQVNKAIKTLKLKVTATGLEQRKTALQEGMESNAKVYLEGDVSDLLESKMFVANNAMKEGLIEEQAIRRPFIWKMLLNLCWGLVSKGLLPTCLKCAN